MARVIAAEAAAAPALDVSAFVRPRDGETDRIDLMVGGLHCADCIRRIEGALTKEPGVVSARVNLGSRRLALAWRRGAADPSRLVEIVRGLGFDTAPFDADALAGLDDRESRRLLRTIAVTGFAAANVMLLSVSVWSGLAGDMGDATRGLLHWVSALIALPAVAYGGAPFFAAAARALRAGALSMEAPISVAVLTAAGISLFEAARGGDHVYFDAAVCLLFFLLIGRFLDRRARSRARVAAEHLLTLRTQAANVVLPEGGLRTLPIAAVVPGMTVSVAAGARIPVDGLVVSGASTVDTALVTGETTPRDIGPSDTVHAGTVNLDAPLLVRATVTDDRSLLAEIVRLIEAAGQARARHVRLADRAARIYAPAVHGLALATFLGWTLIGGLAWQPALMIAVSVLIITCPCALGLAAPVVQVAAAGALLRRGVLLKSPDGLERLAEIDTVVFDKTGTLTIGRPALSDPGTIPAQALRIAASLAAASQHPLCRALVRAVGPVAIAPDVAETPGMGLEAVRDGGKIRLGNRRWCGVPDDAPGGRGSELWLSGFAGGPVRFNFADAPRPDAVETIEALAAVGLPAVLLSGDRPAAVAPVAAALGIADFAAGQTPSDKVGRLAALAAEGHRPLMVGDGLNDAPALAAGFASMSPAEGAAIAQAEADIVFQGSRLAPVAEAVGIARRARRLILQNFCLAFGYNAAAIPLAAAGLVTPVIAALAMSASSIAVTVNALRIRRSP